MTKSIQFYEGIAENERDIEALFGATFTASEGAEEGRVIQAFVHHLFASTPSDDLIVWSAISDDVLVGCICFSRLIYENDLRAVFILSPVAVRPSVQNRGIGLALIARGLDDLRRRGVDLVMTYGDPKYYTKAGFRPVSVLAVQPPMPLSFPEGWLGQPLSAAGEPSLSGPSRCAEAMHKPHLW